MTEPTILHQLRRHRLHVVPIPSLLIPLEITLWDPNVGSKEWRHDVIVDINHAFVVDTRTLCTLNYLHIALQDIGGLLVLKRHAYSHNHIIT